MTYFETKTDFERYAWYYVQATYYVNACEHITAFYKRRASL